MVLFPGRINKTGEWQSLQGFSFFLVDGWPFFVYDTAGQNSHVGRKKERLFSLEQSCLCSYLWKLISFGKPNSFLITFQLTFLFLLQVGKFSCLCLCSLGMDLRTGGTELFKALPCALIHTCLTCSSHWGSVIAAGLSVPAELFL